MPDLQTLKNKLSRRQEERAESEKRTNALRERDQLISSVPYAVETGFWCKTCELDFNRTGLKVTRRAYESEQLLAWYATRCEKCYSRCIRFITDKHLDPYYRESALLQHQRKIQSRDLLQPGDAGFKTLYGDPYKKYHDQMEKAERASFIKKFI